MNKTEYYPYHADLLIKSSIKRSASIFYNKTKNSFCFYYHNDDSVVHVKNQQELTSYLLGKASFKNSNMSILAEFYVQTILVHGTSEQIDFFLAHSRSLINNIGYDLIEPVLHLLSEETIKKIFMNSSSAFAIISYSTHFDSIFNMLKQRNDCVLLLSEFLSKHEKPMKERLKIYIRDILLSHFPHQLAELKKISFIADYLKAQESTQSIIDDTNIVNTQYLKINCILARSQYSIPGHDTQHYIKYTVSFLKALVSLKEKTGVISFQMDDSFTKYYVCSEAYINMNNNCLFTLDDYKTMLHDYFTYMQGLQLQPYENVSKIAVDWLNLALLNYKLQDDLNMTPKNITRSKKL